MAKRTHTEEQIIAALQQADAGGKTTEICRKLEAYLTSSPRGTG